MRKKKTQREKNKAFVQKLINLYKGTYLTLHPTEDHLTVEYAEQRSRFNIGYSRLSENNFINYLTKLKALTIEREDVNKVLVINDMVRMYNAVSERESTTISFASLYGTGESIALTT